MAETILVRSPNWIGDQILSYPFFYYLRKTFPKAWIASVCVEWVEALQFRNLVQEVIVLPRMAQSSHSFFEKFKALEQSATHLKRKRQWDFAFSLPNSLSSAWLLFRSGAKKRRGYRLEGRGFFLNDSIQWDPNPCRHRAQAFIDLLQGYFESTRPALGFWGVPPENELESPVPGELKTFDAENAWPHTDFIDPPSENYWVMAPGSQANSRRWPEEFYFDLAELIFKETGLKGVVVGGPKEAPIAERLCQRAELRDLTAQGSPTRLWKIFKQARFVVSNESGLAHLAALSGSFVQIICGAADPMRTRPLGPGRVQVAVNPVDCWPCEKNECGEPPERKLQCLLGQKPLMIWREIQRGLQLEISKQI